MAFDTIVTWNPLTPQSWVENTLTPKVDDMVARGLTDGTFQNSFPNGPGNPPMIVIRTWTTIEAAEEWKTFCLTATPVAAESVEIPT